MSSIGIPRPGCHVSIKDGISFERGMSGNRMLIIVRENDELIAGAIKRFLLGMANNHFLCQLDQLPHVFVYLHDGRCDNRKRLARIIANTTLFLSVPG